MKTTAIKTLVIGLSLAVSSCTQSGNTQATEALHDSTTSTAPPDSAQQTTVDTNSAKHESIPEQMGATGIDVSHFNGKINWNEVHQAGIDFAYSKATQGESYVDPKFLVNETEAEKAGLKHGAYHFYLAAHDPVKQAQAFIRTVKKVDDGTLPPVLDLEQGGISSQVNVKTFQANVLTWLTEVEKALGVRPVIYTNTPFGNQYLNHPDFGTYHLWIAEYGVKKPRIPKAWAQKGWLLWQRTDRDKIEGMVSVFDQDTLNAPFHELLTD